VFIKHPAGVFSEEPECRAGSEGASLQGRNKGVSTCYYNSSENTALGRSLRLYLEAMASPYAPVDLIAIISPLRVSGSSMNFAKVSDDSHIGPTTS
jgi:hypothetical protein